MKKAFSIILTALMLLTLFGACTPSDDPEGSPSSAPSAQASPTPSGDGDGDPVETDDSVLGYPIVTDGSITLSMMTVLPTGVAAYTNDFFDGQNYAWPEICKRTGITLDMELLTETSYNEQLNLRIASETLSDITHVSTYAGGINEAYVDGVFIRLNEHEDIMPNYMRWVNLTDANRKAAYTNDGNLMAFSQVSERTKPATLGYAVRRDWLDDLSIDMPETIDDWYNMLVRFRDEKTGGYGPMELASFGVPPLGIFVGAYGCTYGWGGNNPFVCIDDKVVYSPATDGFREYLTTMNKWYSENLIEEDYIGHAAPMFANGQRLAENKVGASLLVVSAVGSFYADLGTAEEDCYFELAPLPSHDGETPKVTPKGNDAQTATIGSSGWCISTESKYKEEAIRFLDYFYGDDGILITNYGIEGETFNYVDGKPVQSDLILNHETLNVTNAQELYLIHTQFVLSVEREFAAFSEEGLRCEELWNESGEYNFSASLSFTSEEDSRRGSLGNDLNTYTDEMINKFIMGTEELNDASWETYINTLRQIGYEEYEVITQTAYDRWLVK